MKRCASAASAPLSVGRSIVATWEPQETVVLDTIRELGLELQVIFNKGAVMVLPRRRQQGQRACRRRLTELGLSPHNVVGVGDAENDHAFLSICECSRRGRQRAAGGEGRRPTWSPTATTAPASTELIEQMIDDDLRRDRRASQRHRRAARARPTDRRSVAARPVSAQPCWSPAAPAAASRPWPRACIERLAEQGYQYCIIDPEGDYAELDGRGGAGRRRARRRRSRRCWRCCASRRQSRRSTCWACALADRPAFFAALLPAAVRAARPHRPAALDRASTRPTTCCRPTATTDGAGAARATCRHCPGHRASRTGRARCSAAGATRWSRVGPAGARRSANSAQAAGEKPPADAEPAPPSRTRRCCGSAAAHEPPIRVQAPARSRSGAGTSASTPRASSDPTAASTSAGRTTS